MKIKINEEITQNISDIELGGGISLSNLINNILLQAHPIGSYYWSEDSTNPADLFGGTWEQIKDKFIIAVGDSHTAGTSYGSNTKNISHTHSIEHTHEVPGIAHSHESTGMVAGFNTFATGGRLYFDYNERGFGQGYEENHRSFVGASDISSSSSHSEIAQGGLGIFGSTDSTTPNSSTTNSQSTSTSGSGGSTTLDITPACIAAYCWKRTA